MEKDKRAYYAIIPANVRYDKTLKPNAKLLYGEISALANETGFCWANNNYFAELYDVSNETISRWISQLSKRGYIHLELIDCFQRKIYLFPRNIPHDKIVKGYDENVKGGMTETSEGYDENVNYNNTYNNTINKYVYTKDFEEFYSLYPNKFNKEQTFKNWKSTLKKDTKENILKSTRNYIHYINTNNISKQYIVKSTNFIGQKQEYKGYLDYNPEEQQITVCKVANSAARKILE